MFSYPTEPGNRVNSGEENRGMIASGGGAKKAWKVCRRRRMEFLEEGTMKDALKPWWWWWWGGERGGCEVGGGRRVME